MWVSTKEEGPAWSCPLDLHVGSPWGPIQAARPVPEKSEKEEKHIAHPIYLYNSAKKDGPATFL